MMMSPTDHPSDLPTDPAQPFEHIPVLSQATIENLALHPGGHYLDATVGGGGHSFVILQAAADIRITALDQDQQAIAAAQEKLRGFGNRVQFHQTNFADFDPGVQRFDGILADLGVSSAQLDQGDRGFSFRLTAALDMRMNQQQALCAADIINTWDEKALADLFYQYGEERRSRQLARRIVDRRPFSTTTDLAETIFYGVPPAYRYGRIHPATRIFQALRIAVNRELEVLETFLRRSPDWLAPSGRLAIISFHSLEDRLVKHAFKESDRLKVVTKKPIGATQAEIEANHRSRSAKLRVAERRE